MLRRLQRGIAFQLHGVELIERVVLIERDARVAEQLFSGHDRKGLFHHAVGAPVAVVHRQADEMPVFVEKAEIHAPGVDANGVDAQTFFGGLVQRLLHLKEQPRHVPGKAARQFHRLVEEAVQFAQLHALAVKNAQHRPAAGSAEVKAEEIPGVLHGFPLLSVVIL